MAGQGERPTKPITSSDTVALITNTVIPAIRDIQSDLKSVNEIKGDIKVINNRLENIEGDTSDIHTTINKFRTTLYGNGEASQEGLVTIVAKMKSWITTRSSIEVAVIIGLIVAVFGEVAGFIYVAIRLSALHP